MRQAQNCFVVRTRGRGFYEITESLAAFLQQSGLGDGLAVVHIRHTSASLVIQENADPEVRRDLERFVARLCPDGDPMFRHDCEGPDDMPAHVRSVLTAVNLSIPFTGGQLALGTWQGVFVWEHRQSPHAREVVVHLCGE
jgi:secondary thiamine-phosphate synthase enzyme